MTHALRPIFAVTVLAFGLAGASHSQAANLVNWVGLKPSFSYTPMTGESLERIIAKTMPNSDIKHELLVEAFKALNPTHFSQDGKNLIKTSPALKIPNQNQVFNMVEMQLGEKQTQLTTRLTPSLEEAKSPALKATSNSLLAGTKTTIPKINPRTESWVRFPTRMVALTKKVEDWVRFPSVVTTHSSTADWVRFPAIAQTESLLD